MTEGFFLFVCYTVRLLRGMSGGGTAHALEFLGMQTSAFMSCIASGCNSFLFHYIVPNFSTQYKRTAYAHLFSAVKYISRCE